MQEWPVDRLKMKVIFSLTRPLSRPLRVVALLSNGFQMDREVSAEEIGLIESIELSLKMGLSYRDIPFVRFFSDQQNSRKICFELKDMSESQIRADICCASF